MLTTPIRCVTLFIRGKAAADTKLSATQKEFTRPTDGTRIVVSHQKTSFLLG
jgi:hypothetical protein